MKGFVWVFLLASLLLGCSDSKAVNAAFAQTRVSWFVFDNERPDGLRPLSGFEQAQHVVWLPRNKAVFATDLAAAPGMPGAVAVAGLGLLLLDDADGNLKALRPGTQLPLAAYRTGKLFTWNEKLFVTLSQEAPADLPPTSLGWWAAGQTRLAFYPVPSQVRDPSRQLASVFPPAPGTDLLGLVWKLKDEKGWAFEQGSLDLSNGSETGTAIGLAAPDQGVDKNFDALRLRLAERLGTGVPAQELRGPHSLALFTEAGWVAVGKEGAGHARLFRLPDLGLAGHYTRALSLKQGFVFAWETSLRGYSGAAGLVHVPYSVLAP